MVPRMVGWKVQVYSRLPFRLGITSQRADAATLPESQLPSAVAVCGTTSRLTQMTVSPAVISSRDGTNANPRISTT